MDDLLLMAQERFVALVALAVFVAVVVGTAPLVVPAFPLADLSQPGGESTSETGLWSAVQLYSVLCASALLPAFLWTVWLRRFGGPLEALGLGGFGVAPRKLDLSVVRWIRGGVAGTLVIGFLCVLLASGGWYQIDPVRFVPGTFLTVLLGLILAALYEELLFRGFGYWALSRVGGHGTAIVGTSVLFGLAHANNTGSHWLAVLNTVLAGVLLAVLRWRSGSLWSAWGVHVGWNATLGLLFGAHTSGFGFAGRLLDAEVSAAGARHLILAGGDYGPEGSILLTPMLLIWVVWLWLRGGSEKEHSAPRFRK